MTDIHDHFRMEIVEALKRFIDERIALALDPEPVVDDDPEPQPVEPADDDPESVLE